jgi:23S rRNA pseudouridine2605 synthase
MRILKAIWPPPGRNNKSIGIKMANEKKTAEPAGDKAGERIAKRLARAGIASRREVERMIEDRRVKLDGKILTTPATIVTDKSKIEVDGKPVQMAEVTRLWRYHKPAGLITTARDPQGRPTIFERLPPELPRVVTVGRLDLTSEGLLLLTNDGGLSRTLELPANGWTRRYRVRVHGGVPDSVIANLADGVTVEGIQYEPVDATIDRIQGANTWLSMSLREGKNREIRRLMQHFELPVTRLIRVAYGPFQLGKLDRGHVEEVPARVLREQISGYFKKP